MDLFMIFGTVFDFAKLLFLLSILSFICYKLFAPLREKLADKYSLSWIKSCLVFNIIFIFVLLLFIYLFFVLTGWLNAPIRDPEMEYTLVDDLLMILIASLRIAVTSIILGLFLLFFELVASLFMESKESKASRRAKNTKNNWVKQFTGIVISSALFLVLFLFVFNWAFFGIFLFVFYGYVNPLPLFLLI
jgi:hypothetical protein